MTDTTKYDSGKDWTFQELDEAYDHIRKIAEQKFGLTYYPNQIEVITSEQMLDSYCSTGMPIYYSHWSFGKQFVAEQDAYKRGRMGLAYEIVINSNPCIAYLMEENTMMMQCLVMAHACFGHNSFFKNNVQFKQWTDAEAIIDYLSYAKNYITECEEKYGFSAVEAVLDAAHALKLQGVDRYKRARARTRQEEDQRIQDRIAYDQANYNDLWSTIPTTDKNTKPKRPKFPKDPEENLLYFIEKHAPNLDEWKREILRIVRKIAQYFYPQMLTQIMNEGWATFHHKAIIDEMYEQDLVTDGFMFEFMQSHTGVIRQQRMAPFNPYALGFAMFEDIKRICLSPTEEDIQWFPEFAGNPDWQSVTKFAAYNFKDESFILQYLSPKVMRDFQMFYLLDDDTNPMIYVEAIQNDEGYKLIREKLAEQHNVNNRIPYINVVEVDVWGDRTMILEHYTNKRHLLDAEDTDKTLKHISFLWGYPIILRSVDESGDKLYEEFKYDPDDTEYEEDDDE